MAFEKRSAASYFMRQQNWVYALVIAAGLGLGVYEISSYQSASRFTVEGVDSSGQVTHKSEYSSGGQSKRMNYRLNYTFPTPADPYNNGTQLVTEAFYDSTTEGAEIVVRYLSSDPTINVVEPGELMKGFWVGVVASIVLVLVGIAAGVYAMSRARACVTLRETGEVCAATVTSYKTEGKDNKKGHMFWRDASGVEGRTLTAPLANLLPVGTSIIIFADPERRLKAVWEGDIGSR